MPEIHQKAPDFCLPGLTRDGKEQTICLHDLLDKGKDVILYFYVKDDTPGCTTQACDLRDNMKLFEQVATVVGVSQDTLESHRRFRDKYNLNFILLSDLEHVVMETYEAWGERSLGGVVSVGPIRSTYIIDQTGVIKQKWLSVQAPEHAGMVKNAEKVA